MNIKALKEVKAKQKLLKAGVAALGVGLLASNAFAGGGGGGGSRGGSGSGSRGSGSRGNGRGSSIAPTPSVNIATTPPVTTDSDSTDKQQNADPGKHPADSKKTEKLDSGSGSRRKKQTSGDKKRKRRLPKTGEAGISEKHKAWD